MIPALVLTAGLATRLRPLSFVRAKAALPVGDQVIVERILRWLAGHGVTDAVLNLHHLPHTITALVGDGMAGVRVRYSWETPVLGSAGGPRRALPLLGTSPFLIVNGDTLTNVDVGGLVDAHRRSGALVTMAVIPNVEPAKYGGVVVEGEAVRGFATAGSAAPSYHFVGVQVADADVFAPLRDDVPSESVKEVYPALIAARPGSVRAFVTEAEFFDIGTPADYLSTCLRFEPHGSRIPDPGSRLDDCVVWDDVHVEGNVRLRRCILTDGVRVPAGTSWDNMTVRVAHGELLASERLAGELAIGSIDGTTRA
ncbi:MAG TPA: sugar phosphate nucleotidyltransferase [Vicinamibacterales bacterium]|jgi:NDP-sugar pyrophosphorylase family protein|nr:sugar phosphate nucleotidyltransferase [Vicinamibacterales bacterium]